MSERDSVLTNLRSVIVLHRLLREARTMASVDHPLPRLGTALYRQAPGAE